MMGYFLLTHHLLSYRLFAAKLGDWFPWISDGIDRLLAAPDGNTQLAGNGTDTISQKHPLNQNAY